MLALKVDALSKSYGKNTKAVDSVSFSVEKGKVLALLGPNGAGKTTLFKMMTSLSQPTSGKIHILGKDLYTDAKYIKNKIGYSCQEIGLDPESSALFNIRLFGKYQHIYGARLNKKISELFKLFELESVAGKKVKFLSGGMKKKLEIATSLVGNPEILFLDEPTLGLDIESRKKLWGYIEKLNREKGITIVLTTHYLEEAERLCDKLVIINSGKLIKEGDLISLKEESDSELIKINFSEYDESDSIEKVHSKLKKIASIQKIVRTKNELILYTKSGKEMFSEIVNVTKESKTAIKSILVSEMSLEDIYLKYTGNYLSEV